MSLYKFFYVFLSLICVLLQPTLTLKNALKARVMNNLATFCFQWSWCISTTVLSSWLQLEIGLPFKIASDSTVSRVCFSAPKTEVKMWGPCHLAHYAVSRMQFRNMSQENKMITDWKTVGQVGLSLDHCQ